jgi:hypothetical protein
MLAASPTLVPSSTTPQTRRSPRDRRSASRLDVPRGSRRDPRFQGCGRRRSASWPGQVVPARHRGARRRTRRRCWCRNRVAGRSASSAEASCHVSRAREAGDTTARSTRPTFAASHRPASGACRRPRAANGRSRSTSTPDQSDFACLSRISERGEPSIPTVSPADRSGKQPLSHPQRSIHTVWRARSVTLPRFEVVVGITSGRGVVGTHRTTEHGEVRRTGCTSKMSCLTDERASWKIVLNNTPDAPVIDLPSPEPRRILGRRRGRRPVLGLLPAACRQNGAAATTATDTTPRVRDQVPSVDPPDHASRVPMRSTHLPNEESFDGLEFHRPRRGCHTTFVTNARRVRTGRRPRTLIDGPACR